MLNSFPKFALNGLKFDPRLVKKKELKFIVPKKRAIKKAIKRLVPPPINPENDYQSMCKNKFIM